MLILFIVFCVVFSLCIKLLLLPVIMVCKSENFPPPESRKRYEEERRKELSAQIRAIAEGLPVDVSTPEYSHTPSLNSTSVKGSWEYNPNIHFNIHDELSLKCALSHPGKSFLIETGHLGVQGSPVLNTSSYRNVHGNQRLVESEVGIVHSAVRFKEGNDEGFEIRYTNERGFSRTGRFYFNTNLHCSYDNFIYKMEEL